MNKLYNQVLYVVMLVSKFSLAALFLLFLCFCIARDSAVHAKSEVNVDQKRNDISMLASGNEEIIFNTHSVKAVFKGSKPKLDYTSIIAKKYKTIISSDFKTSKIDFAGYYSMIVWGCGTPCQKSSIIDWRDGKIYNGPSAATGFDYHINSQLLIINPPGDGGTVDMWEPEFYIWDEQKKKFYKKYDSI